MHEDLANHLPALYRFAWSLCGDRHRAEDLAQETMLRALRGWDQLQDSQAVRGWLFRIARNLWTDGYRKQVRAGDGVLIIDPIDLERNPVERLLDQENLAMVLETMQRLPERQRTVLHLIACEEWSIAEVAEMLEVTPEATRASLSVARKQMRYWMERTESEESHRTVRQEFSK